MDWQHLIMNGENLAEYAALAGRRGAARPPARELRLGDVRRRQRGRSNRLHGDARAGRRAAPRDGANGERLGFDLYPYTEDQVGAVRRSVRSWRFIESVAEKLDGPELREAQATKDALRAQELVYAALGARMTDRDRRTEITPELQTYMIEHGARQDELPQARPRDPGSAARLRTGAGLHRDQGALGSSVVAPSSAGPSARRRPSPAAHPLPAGWLEFWSWLEIDPDSTPHARLSCAPCSRRRGGGWDPRRVAMRPSSASRYDFGR